LPANWRILKTYKKANMSIICGRIWKYGDAVNTDVIYPGKYVYSISQPAEMAKHALEGLDPIFSRESKPGDIIVAGKNWGCGSSREQAVTCLKENGIRAIVAKSFGRIHYRNCLNATLPAIICPSAVEAAESGEKMTIDLETGTIILNAQTFTFPPLPNEVMDMFTAGGLVSFTRMQLEAISK
jgi:3-isopropylmalate/(R)-2-methylmalate dehydratase small subunit